MVVKDKKDKPAEQKERIADGDQIQTAEKKEQITDGDQIQTVDQLQAAYPELVRQIINDQTEQLEEFFDNRTASQIKEHFPALYARIAIAQKGAVLDLKVPGFVLTLTDPFAAGTLRTFASLSGQSGLQLPFVLPFKNKHSAMAIKGYIIRAEGGGDYERARAAKDKLKKFK